MSTPHGKIGLGILIFQDIIVVPMMLFTPLLAGETPNILSTIAIMALKILLVLIIVYILAKYIAPKIFGWVVKTKNQELFVLTVVVFCFSVAWLTSTVGLSLALGAFFAGLIISESDYSHQATANVLPFREIFISFFFISVGTLLNLEFFFNNLVTRSSIRVLLKDIADLERIVSRTISGKVLPRELIALLASIQASEKLSEVLNMEQQAKWVSGRLPRYTTTRTMDYLK